MKPTTGKTGRRRGAALIAILVLLGVVSLAIISCAAHLGINRRLAQHREHQLQVAALARSGVELAISQLLTDPEHYTGETLKLLPGSEVRVAVKKDAREKDTFEIVSEARYPTGGRQTMVRSLTCRVHRREEGGKAHIETRATEPAVH